MTKLNKTNASDTGAALPTGITTTYRVISHGTNLRSRSESPRLQQSRLRQWLRHQHPADVVRIVLMLIAVVAVILVVARIG